MNQTRSAVLRVANLGKSFPGVTALAGVDLEVRDREVVALVGPSGSGKTTLLRLIAGLDQPDEGSVEIAGRDCSRLAPERRRVGFVFQDHALFPHLDVARNVAFGLHRMAPLPRRRRVREMLELVRLESMADRLPHQLSGGQQQRVALARAMAPGPALLLLDEPFSNLDPLLRRRVRHEVLSIIRSAGTAAMWVTHDHDEGLMVSDRLAILDEGTIRQVGAPSEVWRRPADAWVAGFIGRGDVLSGVVEGATVQTPLGTVSAVGLPQGRAVDVVVRAEDIVLDPAGAPGKVVRRHFRGDDNLYCVELADGTLVHSRQPAEVELPLGTPLAVRIASPVLPVFPAAAVGEEAADRVIAADPISLPMP
jgi:iron(III) transport system ATP-binding protein